MGTIAVTLAAPRATAMVALFNILLGKEGFHKRRVLAGCWFKLSFIFFGVMHLIKFATVFIAVKEKGKRLQASCSTHR